VRTLRDAIAQITGVLKQAGVDNPRLDARVLIAHVIEAETSQTFIRNDMLLTVEQDTLLAALVQRRVAREPVSRIVGQREFWGLDFKVTPDTLDPRADTEILVSAVIDHNKRLALNQPRILDLGTGTGCVVLALAHALPGSTGVGTDLSEAALRVAKRNADKLDLSERVSFTRMSWCEGLVGPFDIITSNPPYLSADDMQHLSPEVRYDPAQALDGGADGLDCYRAIVADVKRLARQPAILSLEVGSGQAGPVAQMLEDAALRVVEIRSDLASIPRCVVAEI
jgi:release factor glutamine methyltransferase